jgi:two-component system NtrC family sensor kinase
LIRLPASVGQVDRQRASSQLPPAAESSHPKAGRKIISIVQSIERRGRLVLLALALVVAAMMVLLGWVTVRNLNRIEQSYTNQEAAIQIRAMTAQLERALVDQLTGVASLDSTALSELRARAAQFGELSTHVDPQTFSRLSRLDEVLADDSQLTTDRMILGLSLVRGIAESETQARLRLIRKIRSDARFEVELAAVLLALLLAALLVGAWMVRRRIVGPLNDLRHLLLTLAFGDFRPISSQGVAPMLAPLFDNYNTLVNRLEVLEAEHRYRAQELQDEVERATRALLEQHHSLANAERMAAVGEAAASMAHELRNPLSGMLMSLANLRNDVSDPDLTERLRMLTHELERIVRLLNSYLESARHEPEPLRPLNVRATVDELLKLLRYHMPLRIRLTSEIPDGIESLLPRDTFRQILLSLVDNSVKAIGESSGHVTVSAARDDGWLEVSVEDDGPGFAPQFLKGGVRAFASHQDSGTGLGLAMVRRAVNDLGGNVEIGNRDPGGAFVRLTLPYRDA